MIRQLSIKDNDSLMKYLQREPEYNIFIIGDIECYGWDKDYQQVWGEFENDKYVGVLLKYRENLVYYTHARRDLKPIVDLINTLEFDYINGKKEAVNGLEEYLLDYKSEDMYFCALREFTREDMDTSDVIKIDSIKDYIEHIKASESIEEFSIKPHNKYEEMAKTKLNDSKNGFQSDYYIKEDNRIVSFASAVAESSTSAMVIGVGTLMEYRKRGLASKVMNKLCDEYLNNKNKSLCLFFDNPKAGKIYHRLGFKDIGFYKMYSKKGL